MRRTVAIPGLLVVLFGCSGGNPSPTSHPDWPSLHDVPAVSGPETPTEASREVDFVVEIVFRWGLQGTSLFATEQYAIQDDAVRHPDLNFYYPTDHLQAVPTDTSTLYLARVDGFGNVGPGVDNPLAPFADRIAYTHSVGESFPHTATIQTRGRTGDAVVPVKIHANRFAADDLRPYINGTLWNCNVNINHPGGAPLTWVDDAPEFLSVMAAGDIELARSAEMRERFGADDPTITVGSPGQSQVHLGEALMYTHLAFAHPGVHTKNGVLRSIVIQTAQDWRDADDGVLQRQVGNSLTRSLSAFLEYASTTPNPHRDDGSTIADSLLIAITSETFRSIVLSTSDPVNEHWGSRGVILIGSNVAGGSYGDTHVSTTFPGDDLPGWGYERIMPFDRDTGETGVVHDPLAEDEDVYATILAAMGLEPDEIAQYTPGEPLAALLRAD